MEMNDEEYTKVEKNTILNIIKTVSTILFPLITFLFASRVLHAESLGKIKFAGSIVNYVSLIASLGIGTYAIRECSKEKHDEKRLSNLASQLYSINIITTIFAYIVLVCLIMLLPKINEYKELIIIQSGTILFATLGAEWLNMALEDFRYITVRTFLSQMIALIAIFIFVKTPNDYLCYAMILMLATSGGNIANIFYRKKYCKVKFVRTIDIKKHIKPVLFLFSMTLAQNIYVNIDTTMIGLLRNDIEVGLYAAAVNIYTIANQLVASIAYVVMPSMSFLFYKKNYVEINKLLTYSASFIVIIGFPCVMGIFMLAEELLFVMGGLEYVGATLTLKILSFALLGSFFAGFIGNVIMLPSGREKLCLVSSIISAVVNLGLNILFIPKYGIVAAAITTAISQWIGFFVKYPFVEKDIRISNVSENLKSSICGCAVIVVVLVLIKCFISNMVVRVVLGISCSIILYIAILVIGKNNFAINFIEKITRRINKNV